MRALIANANRFEHREVTVDDCIPRSRRSADLPAFMDAVMHLPGSA